MMWYSFFKRHQTLCFDPKIDYYFKGNTGTKDLAVMVLDIDRCENKTGQNYTCANDEELD